MLASRTDSRKTQLSEKAATWCLPLLAGFTALFARLLIGSWIVDDAYITFRFAANLAEGQVLYITWGAVLGSSTTLYVFSLFLAKKITGVELPATALGLNALFDALLAILIVMLSRQLQLSNTRA